MSLSFEIKGARERRAKVRAELQKLGATIRAEHRALSSDERERFAKLQADFTAAGDTIRAGEEQMSRIEADVFGPGSGYVSHEPRSGERSGDAGRETQAMALQGWCLSAAGKQVSARHQRACAAVGIDLRAREIDLRLGPAGMEVRDQSTSGSAGGYTIPQGFSGRFDKALKMFGGVRQIAQVMRTETGNTMPYPTYDDTSNTGELLAENTGAAEQDVTFAQVNFLAYKYSSKLIQVSNELMQDSAFNLENLLGDVLGERIGRLQGAHFTTGTNSSQPQGVVTGASSGITTAGATAITGTEIIRLFHAVDPAYRASPSFSFMMNDGILSYLAQLVDSDGRPIFTPSWRDGTPEMLYGKRVVINQHMQATVATGTVTVLCGDFSKYVVRDAGSLRLRRLDERYAEADQTAFVGFLRSDGRYLNTAAVKKLTQL